MGQRTAEGATGDQRLAGKVVLVTGASSGIGQAIAAASARAGANVGITYRNNAEGAAKTAGVVAAAGRRATVHRLDLAHPETLDALAQDVRNGLGNVDVWINNAGADILTGEFKKLSRREKLDLVLDVDLRGTVLASWTAVELMRAQGGTGVIINMSWDHVGQGMAGENPVLYSAAKGGILSFSRSLARDVAPEIRVNVIAPGFIATAFGQEAPANWHRRVVEATPLKRWGTPEDVAGAAVYLASDEAAFLTGQVIMVNGGVVL
ncbi:MAG TPA: SDR family oxidoreductase [Gemmatimonadales bacterium]|nr:SDR family oxidoreductase [Gemmatimonadales bacterium]